MKLFVFKTTKHWLHCDGIALVTAENYEGACQRLKEKYHEPLKFRWEDFKSMPGHLEAVYCWVFFQKFDVFSTSQEICEIRYQYD